jgi:hypothetical protein
MDSSTAKVLSRVAPKAGEKAITPGGIEGPGPEEEEEDVWAIRRACARACARCGAGGKMSEGGPRAGARCSVVALWRKSFGLAESFKNLHTMSLDPTKRAATQTQLDKLVALLADPEAVKKACEAAVTKADGDKSGAVDQEELKKLVTHLHGLILSRAEATDEEAAELLAELDANGDGKLTAEELEPAVVRTLQKRVADLQAKLAAQ